MGHASQLLQFVAASMQRRNFFANMNLRFLWYGSLVTATDCQGHRQEELLSAHARRDNSQSEAA